MTTKIQKRREFHQLENFRAACRDFPQGKVVLTEKPDFIIHSAEGIVGIELTTVFMDSPKSKTPLQAQESERRMMLNKACRIYDGMNLHPLHVSVFFAEDTRFNKANRTMYATALANLIASNVPQKNDFHSIQNSFDDPASFPFEFHSLTIARFDWQTSSFMNMPDAGWVHEEFPELLQKTISEKNALLPKYQKCDIYWLLIVADWNAPSSFFAPSDKTLSITYESSFDRVFFLNMFDRKASELQLTRVRANQSLKLTAPADCELAARKKNWLI